MGAKTGQQGPLDAKGILDHVGCQNKCFWHILSLWWPENGLYWVQKWVKDGSNMPFSQKKKSCTSQKTQLYFFGRISGPGHLRGVGLGRILGGPPLEPFFGEGGSSHGAVSTPSPPKLKACLPQGVWLHLIAFTRPSIGGGGRDTLW